MILAGDIGGTNTRLGLFKQKGSDLFLLSEKKYASNSWREIELIIEHFLKNTIDDASKIEAGCLSLAGPIEEGQCKLTNLETVLNFDKIRNRFNTFPFAFCNDLVALGYGLKALKSNNLLCLTSGTEIGVNLNKAILAPGTGLGESLIIKGKYITPTEGAHADFAPRNELEVKLWRFLHKEYGHVSYERILSGPGLTNLYRFLLQEEEGSAKALPSLPSPEEISEKGRLDPSSIYYRTLKLFTEILGAEAGNTALKGLALGGVFIGGGIIPRILDQFDMNTFLNAFQDKGRFRELLERIPVYIIREEKTALYGAAIYALEHKNIGRQKQFSPFEHKYNVVDSHADELKV
ncbi:glucokinase [Desulfitobacterium sp. Sab5]|uniref:glucokinase n=1 Tax=Desulfitobacterium nosdiversum TaxID=3375356 RepID=UPI003CE78DC8